MAAVAVVAAVPALVCAVLPRLWKRMLTEKAWDPLPRPEGEHDLVLARGDYGTHLRVWPGAASMFSWLSSNAADLGLTAAGARVVELGSGTGWLGLSVARNLPRAKSVLLTDLPHAIGKLAKTCLEHHRGPAPVTAAALDWQSMSPHQRGHEHMPSGATSESVRPVADVIFGSDLVWTKETARLLPWAVAGLLRAGPPGARAVYGHWDRGFAEVYRVFFDEVKAAGLEPVQLYPVAVEEVGKEEEEGDPWEADLFEGSSPLPSTPVFAVYEFILR
eukprot:TRINITY_DN32353_c0_g1_i1.p1 TRINITY_DN32353_c0_g1~~TRINITY_DN32353_c0_g1_i1.p1  ORF type:complete len:275 (+),score=76.75 TRINITY_DN32353_c0_g1_i1:45-869(+)